MKAKLLFCFNKIIVECLVEMLGENFSFLHQRMVRSLQTSALVHVVSVKETVHA